MLTSSCCNQLLKENSIKYEYNSKVGEINSDAGGKSTEYVFLNNPYQLDGKNQIILQLEDQTVLVNSFTSAGYINIPEHMINKRLRPTLIVKQNDEYYQFPILTTFFFHADTKVLNFIFTPSNERTEGFYVIPSVEKIL